MKQSLYDSVIEQAHEGAKIRVNFKKHTLSINGKFIKLKNTDIGIPKYNNLNEWLEVVESLYDNYKYSRPTSRNRKSKFKALSTTELIDMFGHRGLWNPELRNVAQAKLEVFILLSLINNSFNPNVFFKDKWFYQGKDKSFILKKDYFI